MKNSRGGFTLAEILVVTVLGSIVMLSIYQMIDIQEKATLQQYALISTNENAQMALAVMTTDLKEISARDSDIVAVDSIDITFRALRKAGLVCNQVSTTTADVWEFGDAFAVGDSVLVFSEGANAASAADDGWVRAIITGVASSACASNPLALANTRRITTGTNAFSTVTSGGLIRSFVQTRYRMVDNGEWGELRRTEGSNAETAIIDQLAPLSEGGLRMRFYDSAGTAIPLASLTTRRFDIMRMQIKVAGKAASNATATAGNRFTDSLTTQVYLRGNARGQ